MSLLWWLACIGLRYWVVWKTSGSHTFLSLILGLIVIVLGMYLKRGELIDVLSKDLNRQRMLQILVVLSCFMNGYGFLKLGFAEQTSLTHLFINPLDHLLLVSFVGAFLILLVTLVLTGVKKLPFSQTKKSDS